MTFGWTWAYIEEELLMPQVNALSRYLRRNPPLHLIVASALGVKPPPEPGDTDLRSLAVMFSTSGGSVKSG